MTTDQIMVTFVCWVIDRMEQSGLLLNGSGIRVTERGINLAGLSNLQYLSRVIGESYFSQHLFTHSLALQIRKGVEVTEDRDKEAIRENCALIAKIARYWGYIADSDENLYPGPAHLNN